MFNGENQNPSGENGNDTKNYRDRGRITNKVVVDQKAVEPGSGDQSDDLRAQQEAYQKEIVARFEQKLAEMKRQQSGASSPNQSSADNRGNVSPDVANRLNGEMKKNHGIKGFLAAGAAVGLAATIGFFALGNKGTTKSSPQAVSANTFAGESTTEANSIDPSLAYEDVGAKIGAEQWETTGAKVLTGYEILDSTIDGSFQQYDNVGCYSYQPEDKVSNGAVGNPRKVLEAMGINPDEATPEQLGAVMEYFAYCMEEPAASAAIAAGVEGFEGLIQEQAEDKIHNMSPEEKLWLQGQLKDFFDGTDYHSETGEGSYDNLGVIDDNGEKYGKFVESDLTGKPILIGEKKLNDSTVIRVIYKPDCGNIERHITRRLPDGSIQTIIISIGQNDPDPDPKIKESETKQSERQSETEPPKENPSETEANPPKETEPQPKNQQEANDNSGASAGIVTPEAQERPVTSEPTAPEDHSYNPDTNTYNYTPVEQATNIGYEVTQEPAPAPEPAPAEQPAPAAPAPEMVSGTSEGSSPANDFDAGATVATGEVTAEAPSADNSGDTIQQNLEEATGNPEANPAGDYSEGF